VVGGALVGGGALQVKNTFIDMASGLTPSHMINSTSKVNMTAPADMTQTTGFLQRAMAGNLLSSAAPDRQFIQTPSSSSYNNAFRQCLPAIQSTPLATPSPSNNRYYANNAAMMGLPGAGLLQQATGPAPTYAAVGSRIPAPPTWNPTVQTPPSSLIANAVAPMAAPPGWQPSVFAAPAVGMSAPVAAPLFAPAAQNFVEEDEDADSDDELPPEMRNMEDAPKPPPGALHPSMGSDAHDDGTCKRCCFYPRGRCTNGYDCEFCHYEHEKRKRKNKKKKKKATVLSVEVGPTTVGGAYSMGPSLMQPPMTVPPMMAPSVMETMAADARFAGASYQLAPPQSALYSTAPAAEPLVYQNYISAPAPLEAIAPQGLPMAAPQAQAPPGFVSFQAADGRQVFVQQEAPRQAPMQFATQPPLGAPYLTAPRTAAPTSLAYDVPMPPPMSSPKLTGVLRGQMAPPPMASPKIARGNSMFTSVQQAASLGDFPQFSAFAPPRDQVWVDNVTGPAMPPAGYL